MRAAATVTFHAAKPGHWIAPGKWHRGELQEADIGIPRGWDVAVPGATAWNGQEEEGEGEGDGVVGLIEAAVAAGLPRRSATSTKFTSGFVLVVGGSAGLGGAPRMCAHAAMRAGAGYVTACVPASLQAQLAGALSPEVMSRGLPERDGALSEEGVQEVIQAASRGGAMALGPGLGRRPGGASFARALVGEAAVPVVLDADGLNAFAGRLEELAACPAPLVITPHAGELGRLHGVSADQVERERLRFARQAAARADAVCILKGDDTIVAEPGGTAVVSRGASPALASAGTGDVLTGVIAALLAAGCEPFEAAAAGVWLHAEAGRQAARRAGVAEGVIASDVIAALPAARSTAAQLARGGPADRDTVHRGVASAQEAN
ncbi:MAG: NAD(P)H-hydrate dehydratase [Solirubrobacteraceae bacterium]